MYNLANKKETRTENGEVLILHRSESLNKELNDNHIINIFLNICKELVKYKPDREVLSGLFDKFCIMAKEQRRKPARELW